jgi:hypothetical protein
VVCEFDQYQQDLHFSAAFVGKTYEGKERNKIEFALVL